MDLENELPPLDKDDMILIYLLMSADGIVSDDEQKQFYELLNQYGLKNEKNTIIGKAKDILEQIDSTNLAKTEFICTLYDNYQTNLISEHSDSFFQAEKNYKVVLWSMINMAFADKDLSDNERVFIELFCQDRQIDLSVLEEMIEISQTLISLYTHLNWLKSGINKPYTEIEMLVNELNENKKIIEENLTRLISA